MEHRIGSPLRVVVLALLLSAAAVPAAAHAPLLAGGGEGIAGATLISSPEKSFVIYAALDEEGDAEYYRFPLKEGQVLSGSVQVPGPGLSIPYLAIIGPGLGPDGTLPGSIMVPPGSGAVVIGGTPPGKPAYEPFTPQPVYETARFNFTARADGDYYIAVFGEGGMRYSLAPGFREEFTAAEWLMVPWSVIAIHLWEGQSPWFVFAPLAVVLIGGIALVIRYRKGWRGFEGAAQWLALLAGILYIGGAAMTGLQLVHAARLTGYTPGILLTLLFIAVPVALGIFVVRAGIRDGGPGRMPFRAISLFAIAGLGLLFWAGLVAGPVLAAAAGILVLAGARGNTSPAGGV